jgi:hypothetical protein
MIADADSLYPSPQQAKQSDYFSIFCAVTRYAGLETTIAATLNSGDLHGRLIAMLFLP